MHGFVLPSWNWPRSRGALRKSSGDGASHHEQRMLEMACFPGHDRQMTFLSSSSSRAVVARTCQRGSTGRRVAPRSSPWANAGRRLRRANRPPALARPSGSGDRAGRHVHRLAEQDGPAAIVGARNCERSPRRPAGRRAGARRAAIELRAHGADPFGACDRRSKLRAQAPYRDSGPCS